MMHLNILLICCIVGVLGVISTTRAAPIEVIYTGNGCECPKKLNYLVNMPMPPAPTYEKTGEYGYNLEQPQSPKAKVTYSFDFMVEEPKITPPPPEVKWDLFAKIDRVTAHNKDCYATEEVPRTCSCNRYTSTSRYVLPESRAARFTRNIKDLNGLDNMEEPSPVASQIMAIFLEPIKQTKDDVAKSRNKRDISRIFIRPRRKEKRSQRLVKKYNKHLKDLIASERKFFNNAQKAIRSRVPTGIRPLQQLRNFLTLPSFRNKRDIKGEYDLIEKEHEQMDLTLPEIIQYMPETLDPNFKRGRCHFGQSCRHSDLTESTTKSSTTKTTSEKTNMMTSTDGKDTTPDTLSAAINENSFKNRREEEQRMDNSISTAHIKRNAGNYREGGCPLVFDGHNPTPSPSFTYEPLHGPIGAVANSYDHDPIPQHYVGSSYIPYSPTIIDNGPSLRAADAQATVQHISNDQLDRIIASIVNKHSNFIEASSHHNGALVDPPKIQEQQAKHFLKRLGPWNNLGWFDGHRQYPKNHAHLRYYHRVPETAAYV